MSPPHSAHPVLKRAVAMGYEIHSGARHYHCIHSATGALVIVSHGKRWQRNARNLRNTLAALRRGARPAAAAAE